MKRETRAWLSRMLHWTPVERAAAADALATDAEVKRLRAVIRDEQHREHGMVCGEGCSPRCLRLAAALKPRKGEAPWVR